MPDDAKEYVNELAQRVIAVERLRNHRQIAPTQGEIRLNLDEAHVLLDLADEAISRRAREAEAAQVVDLERLRNVARWLERGYLSGEAMATLRAHLAALEAGVMECPCCDHDGQPCAFCNATGRVVVLAGERKDEEATE